LELTRPLMGARARFQPDQTRRQLGDHAIERRSRDHLFEHGLPGRVYAVQSEYALRQIDTEHCHHTADLLHLTTLALRSEWNPHRDIGRRRLPRGNVPSIHSPVPTARSWHAAS